MFVKTVCAITPQYCINVASQPYEKPKSTFLFPSTKGCLQQDQAEKEKNLTHKISYET